MVSKLGKELRKIRIDCDETAKDMSTKLGVHYITLINVENGKSNPSENLLNKILEVYGEFTTKKTMLKAFKASKLIKESKPKAVKIKAHFTTWVKSTEDQKLLSTIVKKFGHLSKTQKEALTQLVERA
jgi:transcriptional regulator with XRE-family HTH domain